MATNLGLTRMAEACGIPYDVLRWTQEWYVREETLREANTVIVNHHYSLQLARVFGGGTMSSSDGQRFPVRGKSLTGREMVVHGGQVLSSYTHVSDQRSTYGTKVIVPTAREAHYVLDDFLGNATDLPIYRARDRYPWRDPDQLRVVRPGRQGAVPADPGPGKITLVRDDTPAEIGKLYPHAGPLLSASWNEDLITELLDRPAAHGRVAEVRAGHCLADRRQVVGRLPAEHPGGRVEGVGNAAPYDPRRQVPVRPGLPA